MANKRKTTIGNDPLATIVPDAKAPAVKPEPPPKPQKERLTIHLPLKLIDRIKNAVYWTPGLTLANLAEQALGKEVDRVEKNQGKPFPQRKAELKGGRPLK